MLHVPEQGGADHGKRQPRFRTSAKKDVGVREANRKTTNLEVHGAIEVGFLAAFVAWPARTKGITDVEGPQLR